MARKRQLRALVVVTAVWLLWAGWYLLTSSGDVEIRIVDDLGSPVAGAIVSHQGDEVGRTDTTGTLAVGRSRGTLDVSAPGFQAGWIDLDRQGPHVVRMNPHVARGVVTDDAGRPVEGATVTVGYGTAVTDRQGFYSVRLAEPGPVSIWRPAWSRGDYEWDGSPGTIGVSIEPMDVRAVHVTGEKAGDPVGWKEMLELAERTELNGIMLDLKDEDGRVFYDTAVETANRVGSVDPLFDLASRVRDARDAGLYLIGRLVTFQDPIAARAVPEMAITDSTTGDPYNKRGQYFLDPTDPDARAYALALADEACRLGVDEIQFDYVRYPDGFGPEAVFDGGSDYEARVETIRSFLEEARALLHAGDCVVAGDIFGFITAAQDDGGIGQQWEVVSSVLDVVSPMIYPSHYDDGWYGYDDPQANPGPMVDRALRQGLDRLATGAVVRPWLQDFSYDEGQVRAQIDAAEGHGLGWMLWNAASEVTVDALQPAR